MSGPILGPVTQISTAKNMKSLVRGARNLLILAPARAITGKRRARLLGKRLDDVVERLAKELPRDGMGAVATTLNSKDPGRISVGVLPNNVSRHGCPARGESIRDPRQRQRLDLAGAGLLDHGQLQPRHRPRRDHHSRYGHRRERKGLCVRVR